MSFEGFKDFIMGSEGFFLAALVYILIIPIIILGVRAIMKNADNAKPLFTKRVKIIERRTPQGGIRFFGTYCVETDTGERFILKNFDEKRIIIKEGDQGMLSYRGKTIVSFNSNFNRI